MSKTIKITTFIIMILLFIAFLVVSFIALQKNHKSTTTYIYTHTPIIQDSTFTEIEFVDYLKSINIKYPDIVYAQALLESGNFKSPLFKQNNNIFGMTSIGNRPTTASGIRYGFAYFNSWQDSVIDYLIYQCLYLKDKNRKEYLQYLSHMYAEDEMYITKIETIAKEYKSLK